MLQPGLRALIPTIGFIFAGQTLAAVPAVAYKTEKYYDLSGSLGFISAVGFSLYGPALVDKYLRGNALAVLPSMRSFAPRQLIASGLVLLWAARLGSFLYQRIQKSGKDERFDEIKQSPPKFFGAWMMQAAWISLTAMPVWLINAVPARMHPALGAWDAVALGIWAAGWGLEVVADRQKSAWRARKDAGEHNEGFNHDGVWTWSRHPNYAGEVTLWFGQFLLAAGVLRGASAAGFGPWSVGLAASSPVLEYCLIRFISGVPMVEKNMDKKLKDDAEYKKYKATVPCFWPFIGPVN